MGQVIPLKKRFEGVKGILERARPQLEAVLPRHVGADRMLRVVYTAVLRNPKLLDCDPMSLIGAVIQAAQLGLEPDPTLGEAYLIPRWNGDRGCKEVNFQPGYKGLIKLAYQSGMVASIEARCVHQADLFECEHGTAPRLMHVPSSEPDAGPVTHAYCVLRFKGDGVPKFEVLPRSEIERHRNRGRSRSGPWETDYEAMAAKTAVLVTLKLAPVSTEVRLAVALEERLRADVPQDLSKLAQASTFNGDVAGPSRSASAAASKPQSA